MADTQSTQADIRVGEFVELVATGAGPYEVVSTLGTGDDQRVQYIAAGAYSPLTPRAELRVVAAPAPTSTTTNGAAA